MVALSKFYQDHMMRKTCQEMFIHTDSCTSHCTKDILLFTISNFKYFAPICLVPAIIKLRSMDKKKFQNTLKYYFVCSTVGSALGMTINICICLFRHLLGQFGLYTVVFLPSIIGGCVVNLGSQRVIQLYETSMFQCNIETFLLMRRNIISRLIADSRMLQTFIFMTCSALILQGKQLYNLKGFWLLTPNPKLHEGENQESKKCELHNEGNCTEYLAQGLKKYFALGLTLDIVKALMSKVDMSQNQSKIMGKLKNFRIKSVALLTAYVGVYRFTHCTFNRYINHTDSLNHFTSAFLAGFCYLLYPQSTLFSYAIVQATQTVWSILELENAQSKNVILQLLFKIPFGKILFPLALANSVHLMCFKPQYCSALTNTITNGVTNNYPNHIKKEIILLQQMVKKQMSK